MRNKQSVFSILQDIERNKIKKEFMRIQHLMIEEKKNHENINILLQYKKEYKHEIREKLLSGISISQWRSYNDFIVELNKIIEKNYEILHINKKKKKETLHVWCKYRKRLKIWKYLKKIKLVENLKIKRSNEEKFHQYLSQLNFLKKG